MPSNQDQRHAASSDEARAGDEAARIEAKTSPANPVLPRVWESEALFGDAVEVFITHGDQLYRLRRTRNGKLILFK